MEFSKGTYRFHDEPNFNYQMNRWVAFGNLPVEDVRMAAGRIRNLADWKREFLALAETAQAEGDLLREATYYRAVDFFLPYSDPRKTEIYEKLVRLYREYFAEYFADGKILEKTVLYDGIALPVFFAPYQGTAKSRGTILMTGGFDCYKEELIPVILTFAQAGYDFYYFEGPGQGEVLQRFRYPMTHEWEKPVAAVLDGLGLTDVTLIGLSLGGYLAPRAASRDPRINRVIAWGTMYDFFDVVCSRRGRGLENFIRTMTSLRLAPIFNGIVEMKMRRDAYTFWGIDHGMHVMGVKSPYAYFRKLREFTMRKISREIRQDFLLLAGAEDHFCEVRHFYRQASALTNVRSFTGRVFTAAEQAENHCQFGNMQLAIDTMIRWIEERTRENSVE